MQERKTLTDSPVWTTSPSQLYSNGEQTVKSFLLGLALLLGVPGAVLGFDEIFKIETSGTEYCGDFSAQKFSGSSNVDLWVTVVSDTELTVSLHRTLPRAPRFQCSVIPISRGQPAQHLSAGFCLRMARLPPFKALRNSTSAPALSQV
jgi:hypothetical protein